MIKSNHYTGLNQFEPGSRKKVLENLLHIKTKRAMDSHETVALKQAEEAFFRTYTREHRFSTIDICNMHRIWLGRIYNWAGKYRTVDLTKGIRFAHALYVPKLMEDFEKNVLHLHTPCIFELKKQVIKALAEVHVELILIHPFLEGNGRVARILATLMALQAGLPLLDFSSIKANKKLEYFKAVQLGRDGNYKPMEKVFAEVVEKTISQFQK